MTDEIYNIAVTVAVFAAAYLIMAAVEKARDLYAEYSEWSTQKSRAKYRVPAYNDMEQRWTQHENRERLWEEAGK